MIKLSIEIMYLSGNDRISTLYLNPKYIISIQNDREEGCCWVLYKVKEDENKTVKCIQSADSVYKQILDYKREFPNG